MMCIPKEGLTKLIYNYQVVQVLDIL